MKNDNKPAADLIVDTQYIVRVTDVENVDYELLLSESEARALYRALAARFETY